MKTDTNRFKKTVVARALVTAFCGTATMFVALDVAAQSTSPALQRVEITGSAIKRIEGESGLPVQVFKREDIERSGATSVVDLIQKLPAMQGGTGEGGSVGGGGRGVASASLHNLGEFRTLVLLNGRRLVTHAGQEVTGALAAVDLNALPLSAIERVEILSDGASALYGSDAIGGVVNFITKKNSTEGVVSAGVSYPKGGAKEARISVTKGIGDIEQDGYNVLFSLAHETRTNLFATDRDFAKTGIVRFSDGGKNYEFANLSSRGVPANVRINGVLRNPYFEANGTCPPQHKIVGKACYFDYTASLEIYPERTRDTALITGTKRLNADHSLFAELLYNETASLSRIAPPPGEILVKPGDPAFSVPAALGATKAVTARWRGFDLGKRSTDDRASTLHFVVGAEGLLAGWDYNTAYTHSESKYSENLVDGWTKLSGINAALRSGQINPFLEPGKQTVAAQALLEAAKLKGYYDGGKNTLDNVGVRGSRAFGALEGGPIQLGLGANYLREKRIAAPGDFLAGQVKAPDGSLDTRFGDSGVKLPYSASRNSYGVYSELSLPVTKQFELTTSLRADHYSDFGNTLNYKLAARYQPRPEMLFRASLGSGFKAPTVPQVNASRQDYGVTGGNYDCPFSAGELEQVGGAGTICPPKQTQYNVFAEGNKKLRPEKSKQFAVGMVLEPNNNFSFGADLWSVFLKDQIGQLSEQTVFSDAQKYRNQFTTYTDPATGEKLLAFLANNVNLGKVIQQGIDFNISGRAKTPVGPLTSNLLATYMLRDRYQLLPDTPYETSLGTNENGAVTFRWQGKWINRIDMGNFSHSLTTNFKSGYKDQAADVDEIDAAGKAIDSVSGFRRHVKRYYTFDLQSTYRFSKVLALSAGILNIADRSPPLSLVNSGTGKGQMIGYDDRYYDPRGRTFYVNGTFKF